VRDDRVDISLSSPHEDMFKLVKEVRDDIGDTSLSASQQLKSTLDKVTEMISYTMTNLTRVRLWRDMCHVKAVAE